MYSYFSIRTKKLNVDEGIKCYILYVSHIVRLDQQSGAIPCQELVLGNQWRELENMKAQFVAVNGIRKVACVVCYIYIQDPLYLVCEDFSLGYYV